MATTITAKNQRIESARSYKDLDLNFTAHPIKKDVSKHLNEYAIINSVKNLVSTNFFERPFRPEIGSGVRNLLFENVDPLVAAQLERAISEIISNYEPRAVLKNVNVVSQPDKNAYSVTLTFYIENSSIAQTITLLLERNR